MVLKLEEGADDAEGCVDEHPGLGDHQQQVVQLKLPGGVVPQGPNLE